jgi:hypothetical protein
LLELVDVEHGIHASCYQPLLGGAPRRLQPPISEATLVYRRSGLTIYSFQVVTDMPPVVLRNPRTGPIARREWA